MAKKLGLTLVMLFLLQGIACAGLINIYVASGSVSGSISPKGGYAATAKMYTLTASTNYTIDHVTKNGVTVSSSEIIGTGPTTWTYTVPLSSGSQTVYVYFKTTSPANPPVLIASAPVAVSAAVQQALLISGGTSTILYLQPGTKAKYKWSSTTASPAVTFSPISSSVTSPAFISTNFTAAAAGSYTATLTLTAPGATSSSTDVKVTVVPPGLLASNMCLSCHSGTIQADAYGSSLHAASTQGPTCAVCHNPSLTLQHPGYSITDTKANPGLFYVCVTCHTDGGLRPDLATFHAPIFTTTPNICVSCHNQHSLAVYPTALPVPHINSVSSGQYFYRDAAYSASYVTPRTQCSYCHGTPAVFQNSTSAAAKARADWSASGKGDVQSVVWMNSSSHNWHASGTVGVSPARSTNATTDCVRCHTSAGFTQYVMSNYSTLSPVGTVADKSAEPLTCNGCHNSNFTVRTTGLPLTAYYNYNSTATGQITLKFDKFYATDTYGNPPGPIDNAGSKACIPCHAGRESGSTIHAAARAGLNFSNVGFVNSHYMSAAGTMYRSTGYEYAGLNYGYLSGFENFEYQHPLIGTEYIKFLANDYVGGTNGPCVGCHMTSPNKHKFSVFSSANNGAVTKITSPICEICHAVGVPNAAPIRMTVADVNRYRSDYSAALDALQALLFTKGIVYTSTYPYFYTTGNAPYTNWESGDIVYIGKGSDVMGAAFNFNLLKREPGAYVHNSVYTKRLLYDAIDFLDDGILNNTVSDTIDGLAALSASQKHDAKACLVPRP